MIDPTHHTDDTPQHWDRYADMLRRQSGPVPSEYGSARMLANVHASIAAGPRPGRAARWVVAPALAVATILVVILFASLSAPRAPQAPKAGVAASAKESSERPKQMRRQSRNRLPAPSIPSTPLPALADTALVPRSSHVPPLDPIGPGGNRVPRSGAYRPGTSSPASP